MEGSYYAPMYGGLMLPVMKRQPSDTFQPSTSIYGMNSNNQSETPTPLSSAGAASASRRFSPHDSGLPLGFHLGKRSMRTHQVIAGSGISGKGGLPRTRTDDSVSSSLQVEDDDDLDMDSVVPPHPLAQIPETQRLSE